VSAIDITIWDIISKANNKPIHRMLSGHHERASIYASPEDATYSTKDLVREHIGYVKQGFKATEMRAGLKTPTEDIERVAAVRDAIG